MAALAGVVAVLACGCCPPCPAASPGAVPKAVPEPQSVEGLPLPYIDAGACPGECCTYGSWTAREHMILRADPNPAARPVAVIEPGQVVQARQGLVIVSRPGVVELLQAVAAKDLRTRALVRVPAGHTLYLLTYVGEGISYAWHAGRMVEIESSVFESDPTCTEQGKACVGRRTREVESTWWVQIATSEALGWTDHPETFAGRDACMGGSPSLEHVRLARWSVQPGNTRARAARPHKVDSIRDRMVLLSWIY